MGEKSTDSKEDIVSSAREFDRLDDTMPGEIRAFRCAQELRLFGDLDPRVSRDESLRLEAEANYLIGCFYDQESNLKSVGSMSRTSKNTLNKLLIPEVQRYVDGRYGSREFIVGAMWHAFTEMLQYSHAVHYDVARISNSRTTWESIADLCVELRMLVLALKIDCSNRHESWRREYPWLSSMIEAISYYAPLIHEDGTIDLAILGRIARARYSESLRIEFS